MLPCICGSDHCACECKDRLAFYRSVALCQHASPASIIIIMISELGHTTVAVCLNYTYVVLWKFCRDETVTSFIMLILLLWLQSSVAVVKTSGYSLHRSPSKVTMNIKQDLFFGDKPVSAAYKLHNISYDKAELNHYTSHSSIYVGLDKSYY
jgi:hypothetical protein